MKKIATLGILLILLAVIIGQFGFFQGISQKLDRATAVQRAEMLIEKGKRQADSLTERSREMRVKKRMMELSVERDEEDLGKTEYAIKQLAQTIKKAGLPRPSEIETLTDEQKQTKIVFTGKEGSAMDAYIQLGKWQESFERKSVVVEAKRNLIAKLSDVADKMLEKQKEIYAQIEKIKVELTKLETEREIAAVKKELAELGAASEGVNVGDLGKVMETLRNEIDEANSTTDVINEEAGKPKDGDVFSMPDQSSELVACKALDTLWD